MPIMTKTTRKRTPARKTKFSMPTSAAITKIAGQSLLIVPVDDFESWMEDQIDIALAKSALAEKKPRIPMEEVHRKLGIK